MKVHLVDGTYELFRAYFGAPSASAPDGREVGAVRGLVQTMLALLRQSDVTHVGVAFDSVIESFRNDMFSGYKSGAGVPAELLGQFGLAEIAMSSLGVVVWPMVEFEADDALASAARSFASAPNVEQVVVCSPDKDLAQVVEGDRIVCLDRRRDAVLNEPGVLAKFGVGPSSIPDYLALVGDSADGIPGIPKWGSKTSATVLRRYGHLEQIPEDGSDWDVNVRGAEGAAASLALRREDAVFYRELATLRLDVPIGVGQFEDLKDPQYYAMNVFQGGLGLPDREYYFNEDDASLEIRDKYVEHIEMMFDLAGLADGADSANTIMALETRIAEQHLKKEDARNWAENYNKVAIADLGDVMPAFNWDGYLEELGIADIDNLVIFMTAYLSALDEIIEGRPESVDA